MDLQVGPCFFVCSGLLVVDGGRDASRPAGPWRRFLQYRQFDYVRGFRRSHCRRQGESGGSHSGLRAGPLGRAVVFGTSTDGSRSCPIAGFC